MLARFFIDRPVLAWVISVVIVLFGAVAVGFLPVAEYPEIQPPTVRVTANYPGANAQIVADTVAAPIEQQVVGVEGMMYMSSQSNNDGSYTLDVTFAIGTEINMAQVLVQNRVAIAQPTLLVGGEDSLPAFIEVTNVMAQAMPQAKVEWIEGGHIIDPAHPAVHDPYAHGGDLA